MKQIINTAFSTCPNDTFIFDALVHQKIDTSDLIFNYTLRDIDELNIAASENSYDLIKVSYAKLPALLDRYVALTSGGALGFNCGPMLVAKDPAILSKDAEIQVVIPGNDTTANYLLNRYFPRLTKKKVLIFSDIEDAVATGDADAGVIIHESRFTFESKGLSLLADMGELWHSETNLPIPLGCIAVKRSLNRETVKQINRLVRESVIFAFNNPDASCEFVKSHANSVSDEVIRQHIALYVNDFSTDLGKEGKTAVRSLLSGKIPPDTTLFSDETE